MQLPSTTPFEIIDLMERLPRLRQFNIRNCMMLSQEFAFSHLDRTAGPVVAHGSSGALLHHAAMGGHLVVSWEP